MKETIEKTREENRVKGFREVERGENSTKSRLRVVEAIRDRLGQIGDVSRCRAGRTEVRLGVRQEMIRFRIKGEANQNELFKETRETRGDGDGAIGSGRGRRFARFENRENFGRLPLRKEKRGRPAAIKNR